MVFVGMHESDFLLKIGVKLDWIQMEWMTCVTEHGDVVMATIFCFLLESSLANSECCGKRTHQRNELKHKLRNENEISAKISHSFQKAHITKETKVLHFCLSCMSLFSFDTHEWWENVNLTNLSGKESHTLLLVFYL